MKRLIYPTIELFLYDLHDSFGRSQEEIEHSRRRFWSRLYPQISEGQLQMLEAHETSLDAYIELLGKAKRIEPFEPPMEGYYYPVKVGDTYALQLDCSGYTEDPNWASLPLAKQLITIRDTLLQHVRGIPGDLGESWFIWGQLPPDEAGNGETPPDYEAIARECYEASQVIGEPDWRQDFSGRGIFRGVHFFELQQQDSLPDGSNQNRYVLIGLFPPDREGRDRDRLISHLNRHLIRLFHYRNKILWAYEQSRQLKTRLKQLARNADKRLADLSRYTSTLASTPTALKPLQTELVQALQDFHHYQVGLGYLKDQLNTVKINAHNYQVYSQALDDFDPEGDLSFLGEFNEFATERCLAQIGSDHEALTEALQPFDNFINTVEGIIEIERVKNERVFNRTVAIASVGISTASLAASAFTDQVDGIIQARLPVPAGQPTPTLNLWLNFGLTLAISLCVGLLSILALWLLSRLVPRSP